MALFRPLTNSLVTHEDFLYFQGPFGIVEVPKLGDPSLMNRQVLTQPFMGVLEEIKTMESFEDDVWVITSPKSGTTWTQELVWLLRHDLDYETAGKVDLKDRVPYLEGSAMVKTNGPASETINIVKNSERPRTIKSHLIPELLPNQLWKKKSKIVYVTRNPKDVVISRYHFSKHFLGYSGTFEVFLDWYLANESIYGSQLDHVKAYWELRDQENVFITSFEKLKTNMLDELKKCSRFLGKEYSEEQLLGLQEHLKFENMKKNPSVNLENHITKQVEFMKVKRDPNFAFIRKGVIGGYKEEMSPEYDQKFDAWIKSGLEGTGFQF